MNQWGAASGLVFIQVAPGQGQINFSNVDFNTTSYAGAGGIGFYPFGNWDGGSWPYFTGPNPGSGEIFMNSQYQNADGTVNLGTMLHEIGHAIGLKHPTEVVTDYVGSYNSSTDVFTPVVHDQVLSSDDPTQTIMATVGDTQSGSDAQLKPLDQEAAAFLYGPAGTGGVYTTSASGSNSLVNWSWDATTQTLTQTAPVSSADIVIHGTSVNNVIDARQNSGNDQLFGYGGGTNTLYAGSGNDKLYGGTGTNTLVGGAGSDTFYVDSAATTVTAQSTGTNTVYSTVSFLAPANIHYLSVFGANLTATGNGQNDDVFGDPTNATTIIGGSGYDYLAGGSGDDTLIAGAGTDLMFGGSGSNTFVFKDLADAPVGGPNYATIGDFKDGVDKIDLSAITSSLGVPLSFIGTAPFSGHAGQVDEVTFGQNTLLEADFTGDGVADFEVLLYGNHSLAATDLTSACFCKGTLIETAKGGVPVECLAIGDEIMTLGSKIRPIKWIGRRSYSSRFALGKKDILPVCIKAGALDNNVPRRDLWISPHHAMYLEGVLVEAKDLVNDVSIVQVAAVESIEYFHIELATHDVIFAEAAMSESFIDDDSRGVFHNADEYRTLYPDEPSGPARYCAPRLDAGYEVEAARRHIDIRAGLRCAAEPPAPLRGYVDEVSSRRVAGWAQNVEHPEAPVVLEIYAGSELIGQVLANRYRGDLMQAGIGSGYHSFEFAPVNGLDFDAQAIEVRRPLDGATLSRRSHARPSHGSAGNRARAGAGNR